jgi:hypothetical protein
VLYYFNNLLSVGNKGNKAHGGAARWTSQEVDFIDEMNEASPGGAAGRAIREYRSMGVSEYRSIMEPVMARSERSEARRQSPLVLLLPCTFPKYTDHTVLYLLPLEALE